MTKTTSQSKANIAKYYELEHSNASEKKKNDTGKHYAVLKLPLPSNITSLLHMCDLHMYDVS